MEGHMQEGYPAEGEGRAEVAVGIYGWAISGGSYQSSTI